jgi:serine/threonine protein phosphatase PrpC
MNEHAAATNAASTTRLVVRAVLRTDVGLVRSENQDFGTCTTPEEERDGHPGGSLLIVADGMGGHRGGATASRLAGETVKAQYLESETTDIATALQEALARANARIFTEAQSNPDLRGMGTTASALAVRNGDAWFGHVGDSRIYLVRGHQIEQLTEDHSLVASMVREGLISTKEAETHPRRNVLQRSMGVGEDVEIDVRGPFHLQLGDTFILCSDGLHGLVKEPELKEVAQRPIEQAADEYLRLALQRGAPDNVTVIVARVEADDPLDETLADRTLDDTQPLLNPGPDAFDETVRDSEVDISGHKTAPMLAIPALASAPPLPDDLPTVDTAPPAEEPSPAASAPATRAPAVVGAPRAKGAFLRWLLLVVIALGALGAWFYWSQ